MKVIRQYVDMEIMCDVQIKKRKEISTAKYLDAIWNGIKRRGV